MPIAKSFEASTHINRSPDEVWNVLVDTKKWHEWDPYCEKIEGEVKLGSKVKAFTTLSPDRAFPVTVATLDPMQKMVWRGGMPFGLFVGERTFSISPKDGGTAVHVREEFRGLLAGMIAKSIPNMDAAFEAFVTGLKERTESAA